MTPHNAGPANYHCRSAGRRGERRAPSSSAAPEPSHQGVPMSDPVADQSLTELLTATSTEPQSADAPPSFMTPLSHRAPAVAPVSGYLPDKAIEPPAYARPVGDPDRVHVDAGMVTALIADLDSIASAQGQTRSDSAAPVCAGLPGSDVEKSCSAADAAVNSALDAIHSRLTSARDNVSTSLETYLATEAENTAGIGRAGTR